MAYAWTILALVVVLALCWRYLGHYLAAVFEGRVHFMGWAERPVYRLLGVDPGAEQPWQRYAGALVVFSGVAILVTYALERLQAVLPLNPQHLGAVPPALAWNTAVSFVTNTNWQNYAGETTMSYLTQMSALTVQQFVSAAVGIAVAIALVRGFARRGSPTIGNFWADIVRCVLYVLLPVSFAAGVVFVGEGAVQTLAGPVSVHDFLTGTTQVIARGPVGFMEAIKQLGTNGGGYFNANSAHPFENPNAWSTMFEAWLVFLIPIALTFTFGRIVKDARQGYALLAVIGIFVIAAIAIAYAAEAGGNPLLTALGVDPAQGNMEGKELRFGIPLSVLFNVITTASSCGAVNAMLDSYMPLGGMTSMFLIQLGEIVPGGVGSGLYGLLVFALIAVFVAGLMVGRTPEYLGKKIQAKEVKLAMLAVLILPLAILGFAALSLVVPAATASLGNAGPHGLSEMLYAFTSATGNNGSAFAGLTADTPWLDTTIGIAMLLGRFAFLIPVLAIAGSLAEKVKVPASSGTFPTHGPLFVGLLCGVIVIMGGLQFMPALSLGPLAEHFTLLAGKTF